MLFRSFVRQFFHDFVACQLIVQEVSSLSRALRAGVHASCVTQMARRWTPWDESGGPPKTRDWETPEAVQTFKTPAHPRLVGPLSWSFTIPTSQRRSWSHASRAALRWLQKFWSINRYRKLWPISRNQSKCSGLSTLSTTGHDRRSLSRARRQKRDTNADPSVEQDGEKPGAAPGARPLVSWWSSAVALLGYAVDVMVLLQQPYVWSGDDMVDGSDEGRQSEIGRAHV